jgi:hypothetical protein
MPSLLVGNIIKGYKVIDALGEGGFGETFLVEKENDNK